MENNQERAMKLATEAGHILLENGAEISRVVDVNQLSRDVVNGRCTLDELEKRLYGIRHSKAKPVWGRIISLPCS